MISRFVETFIEVSIPTCLIRVTSHNYNFISNLHPSIRTLSAYMFNMCQNEDLDNYVHKLSGLSALCMLFVRLCDIMDLLQMNCLREPFFDHDGRQRHLAVRILTTTSK